MKSLLEYEALKLRQKRRNMKNKTIRIYKKASVQDYARAHASTINHAIGADIGAGAATGAALGTIVPGIGNVIGGIVGGAGGLLKGATSSDPASGKVNKKDFYASRDAVYSKIKEIYGINAISKIAGNPFSQFSHTVIKDSPFKNYKNEMVNFLEMVKKYFPDLAKAESVAPTETIAPLNKTMEKAILDSGMMPPGGGVAGNLEVFSEKIVEPATGQKSVSKQAMENAAIEFIATLVEKKRNGETLPPVYDKIAGGAMKVEEKVEQNVKASVAGDIGLTIMNNPLIVIGAFILIIVLMTRK